LKDVCKSNVKKFFPKTIDDWIDQAETREKETQESVNIVVKKGRDRGEDSNPKSATKMFKIDNASSPSGAASSSEAAN